MLDKTTDAVLRENGELRCDICHLFGFWSRLRVECVFVKYPYFASSVHYDSTSTNSEVAL